MTVIEITLIIVGMFFILASFWVTEKLSPEEMEHISELSRDEMNVILEKELNKSRQRVVDMVEKTIDSSKEHTERALEKQTNEKIMAINEYSDTVIEKMNKTHNEIMFLYSMLNDKHTELTNFSSSLTQQIQDFRAKEEELTNYYLAQLKSQKPQYIAKPAKPAEPEAVSRPAPQKPAAPTPQPSVQVQAAEQTETAEVQEKAAPEPAVQEEDEVADVREEILRLYKEGKESVAIAKKLGMGVGEVRLILGLYKGE